MKLAFNITGLSLTIVFAIVIFYYAEEVSDARLDSLFSSLNSSSYYGSSSYTPYYSSSDSYSSITEEAGLVSLFFFGYFLFLFIFNLRSIKTKTVKVLSIIGISLTGLWLMWDFLMVADGGALSFDEIAPGFLFYNFVVLAFALVGMIHALRLSKQ